MIHHRVVARVLISQSPLSSHYESLWLHLCQELRPVPFPLPALLSLVQTCRDLDINPQDYLEDALRRIMGHPAQRIQELLPDLWLAAKQKDAAR